VVPITARQSASAIRVSGRSLAIPAQITIASAGPSSSSARPTQEMTSAAPARSVRVASTRTPSSEAAFSSLLADCSSQR
jgi:hypothetical protein